jgi:hypothetical protein
MGARTNALATQFEQAVADFAAAIEKCPDGHWTSVPVGSWTVAATAQHVAGQFPLEAEYITAAAEGRELPSYSMDDINGMNDKRATRESATSKSEALKTLREGAASMAAYIRGLDDAQLDRKSKLPLAGGADVTTQQLIEGGVLIDHVKSHLPTLTAAA